MIKKAHFKYYILLIFGIFILINILAAKYYFRLDFTEDKRYTLSESTLDIIKNLNEPVTVTAYFSENLQPELDRMRQDFRDLLVEYNTRSNGMVVFKFVNPNEDPAAEQKAVQAGVQTLMIEAREKDQATTKKAYMGATVEVGEQTEVIPFIQSGAQMEYELSSTIKKLTDTDKPFIGFITGHGEPSLQAMLQVVQQLNVLYMPEEVEINDTVNLAKYKTLVWINPQDTITAKDFQKIDAYLQQGGNLFIAINRVDARLQQGMGVEKNTGLENWLASEGVQVASDFVIDANCGAITVQQRQGVFTINQQVNFPYLPVISNFTEHPATAGIDAMMLQFASSLSYTGDSTWKYTALAFTSEKSGKEPAPVYFNIQRQWTEADFPDSKIPVAALLENNKSKIIVITDGEFAINGTGQQAHQVQDGNAAFVVNSIDFMSDDTGLIQLRSKKLKIRLLDQLDDATKQFLKILNFVLPILIIVLIGIFRYQKRKIIRLKRKGDYYV
jgi:gliding-associated putative ABC transporter substrate-binding component GldG